MSETGITAEAMTELRSLIADLPDGPWFVSDCEGQLEVWPESALRNVTRDENGQITGYRKPPSLNELIAEWELDTWDEGEDVRDDQRRTLARFMVAARAAMPALLAEVAKLDELVAYRDAEDRRLRAMAGERES